jgi:hypothetical protein
MESANGRDGGLGGRGREMKGWDGVVRKERAERDKDREEREKAERDRERESSEREQRGEVVVVGGRAGERARERERERAETKSAVREKAEREIEFL